jgi:hypothetical protein
MGRALVLLIVAVATGWLVYSWAAPRFLSPGKPVGVTAPAPSTTPVPASPALEAQRSPEQRERDTLEAQRAPFYTRLQQEFGSDLATAQPDPQDGASLELYATQDNPQLLDRLLSGIIQPEAARYGFRHLSFFLPNTPDDAERYRLDAEATQDAQGVWHAFRK